MKLNKLLKMQYDAHLTAKSLRENGYAGDSIEIQWLAFLWFRIQKMIKHGEYENDV